MNRRVWLTATAVALFVPVVNANAETIRGKVVNAAGKAMGGVMVSAFDEKSVWLICVLRREKE